MARYSLIKTELTDILKSNSNTSAHLQN